MNFKNTTTHYNTLSISLHWLMLILIVTVYGSIELRELFEKGTETRDAFKMWHFMLGLSVLVLVSVRLVARVVGGAEPAIKPEPAKWQNTLAKYVHLALYVFKEINKTPTLKEINKTPTLNFALFEVRG
ncbi:cytochrome b/b6 domain-containing protein [Pseudoalteromonas sp. SWYJ118]|nr:cytochrome b/b6 domain-containing protein [Pseudoalteromonas sp. SWYJ118]